jgi:multicomponent Na+:H+ antiporter subunit G
MALLLVGVFFLLVAGLGLVRMPDFYNRAHAATKAMTLGVICLTVGGAILFTLGYEAVNPVDVWTKVVLIVLFQFVANPVGAHVLARAAHETEYPMWERTIGDELGEDKQPGDSTKA